MPFTLTWAGPVGPEKLVVQTPEAAVREHVIRSATAQNLKIKDDAGREVTVDQLMAMLRGSLARKFDA
jgi:hypothetical protein